MVDDVDGSSANYQLRPKEKYLKKKKWHMKSLWVL